MDLNLQSVSHFIINYNQMLLSKENLPLSGLCGLFYKTFFQAKYLNKHPPIIPLARSAGVQSQRATGRRRDGERGDQISLLLFGGEVGIPGEEYAELLTNITIRISVRLARTYSFT